MNVKETAAVLGMFAAAYPGATIADGTPQVWAEHLAGIDPRDGLEAARDIIRNSPRFPSVALYLEAVRSAVRERAGNLEGRTPENSRSTESPAELEEIAGLTDEQITANRRGVSQHVRDIIAANKNREHWHGGPNPCPVCGGINPNLKPGESTRKTIAEAKERAEGT